MNSQHEVFFISRQFVVFSNSVPLIVAFIALWHLLAINRLEEGLKLPVVSYQDKSESESSTSFDEEFGATESRSPRGLNNAIKQRRRAPPKAGQLNYATACESRFCKASVQ